jgi:hypothetical protein
MTRSMQHVYISDNILVHQQYRDPFVYMGIPSVGIIFRWSAHMSSTIWVRDVSECLCVAFDEILCPGRSIVEHFETNSSEFFLSYLNTVVVVRLFIL